MEALIVAQTIFYFTVSVAIIVLGVLCAIAAYYLIRIAKELEVMSRDWHNASDEARARINEIIDRLSDLPILSYFLRKEPHRGESRRDNLQTDDGHHKKGRGKR